MFSNYLYLSSTSKSFRKHFEDAADKYIREFKLSPKKSYVIDIGSNDGVALKPFKDLGYKKILGIEPAKNLAKKAIYIEQEVLKEVVGSQDQVFAAFGGFNRIEFSKDGSFQVKPILLEENIKINGLNLSHSVLDARELPTGALLFYLIRYAPFSNIYQNTGVLPYTHNYA